jgi:anti-anti-sigma factor
MFSIHVGPLAAGGTWVSVAGELDLSTCSQLDEVLAAVVATTTARVEVDLSGVSFLDCRAVATLVNARNEAIRRGVRFTVHNAAGIVRRVLELAGVAAAMGLTGSDRASRIAG